MGALLIVIGLVLLGHPIMAAWTAIAFGILHMIVGFIVGFFAALGAANKL